jgi:DNA-binding CsgD family transcriptional regulator
MSKETEPEDLVDLIYEAALESNLWPNVLVRLAEAMGALQVAMPSLDRRANVFAAIAPRLDADMLTSYKEYWAFHDPALARATAQPVGEIYNLDSLMPRDEFAATPVFNEFWRPAEFSLDLLGATLLVEDQLSALICFSNSPGKKPVTVGQMRTFKTVLPHLVRAVRISRQLRDLEFKGVVATERLETLPEGALLTDPSARVIWANAAAKLMLDEGGGVFLDKGRLAATHRSDVLQMAIASCAQTSPYFSGMGGEFEIPQETPRAPIYVTVTPLRSKVRLTDVPWTSHGAPVAIVIARDPDRERRQREAIMRRRFGLTSAESALAVEILKGDGRVAAARRCGITCGTAKTHLSSIFEKTETHRQAELVRVLLAAADTRETDTKSVGSWRRS